MNRNMPMGKIGVCACYNTKNYGSMLQTLATGEVLDKLGYDYEFIYYTRKPTMDLILRSLGRIPEFFIRKINNRKKCRELKKHPETALGIKVRNQCFDEFMNRTFTKLSPRYDTYSELKEASKKYSAVLVGSDQLWRPEGYSTGFYNLMFVPDNVLKIAYATSFGVSHIPKKKVSIAKEFLSRIEFIGVRELRASEIIQELIGRHVPTVVDPTLLFSGDAWKELIPQKKIVEEKYIFCYLLGTNHQHRSWVKKLGEKTGYKIVTIPHLDEFVAEDVSFGDIQLFEVGPAEFVNLIRYAEYVCTDSFHGTVFSILNHKRFVTFNRFSDKSKDSRNSRIDSLLKQTQLEKRRMANDECSICDIMAEDINFENVEVCLNEMRNVSLAYLRESLAHV